MRKNVELDDVKYINAVRLLLPFADIVKMSDEDLTLLGIKGSPLESAKQVLSMLSNGMVLLTKGEHGATLLTNEVFITKPVFEPTEFIDAVGAGDTFFSSFLSYLLRERQLKQPWQENVLASALEFGLMAATLNVERNGCQPPTKSEVYEALEKRG